MNTQEQRFRDFVQNSPVGIYRTTPDGLILMANPALVAMLGFGNFEELAAARNLNEGGFDPPGSRQAFLDHILHNGQVQGHQSTWLRQDDTKLHVIESAWAVREPDGRVGYFEGTVQNISARVQAEDQLRESELLYRQLIEALPHGIAIVQHERIVFVNSTIGRMLRLADPGQVIGQPADFGLADHDRARVVPLVWQALKNDGPWPLRFLSTTKRSDGTHFPSETICHRITYGHERALQFIIMDISERKAAEKERELLIERLHQADKLSTLGQLAAGVAHEINNPLTFVLPNQIELQKGIEVLVELFDLHRSGAPAEAVSAVFDRSSVLHTLEALPELINDNREGLERIRGVTRELKEFSRIERDDAEPLDLVELVESALKLVHNQLRYRAQVIRQLEPLPQLVANRGKLSQVLLNILLNAAQAIEEGAPERHWVRVRTGQESDGVFVEIANNGPPIPDEQRERIFDPFFTTKPRGLGTGLGLAISWNVIQQHSGRIEVSSDAGNGTVFRIWLPRETGLVPGHAPAVTATGSRTQVGRILVIDDEPAILRLFERILREHQVVTASDGRLAAEQLQFDTEFDVIFCDMMMPGLSGTDLHARLSVEQPGLADKMVFMTGGAFTPAARAFLDRVDNLRLDKPVNTSALRALVGQLLEDA